MAKKTAARKGAVKKTAARKGARKTAARKGATKKATRRAGAAKKSAGTRKTARKTAAAPKRGAAKRELIDTGTDKRFIRRNAKGRIKESDDVGRSLSGDQRRKARTKAKRGQGDKGDR